VAVAQQAAPAAEPQQREQQEKAQQTPSGKMGKEEPSSHAPSDKPADNSVFVNGALAVPGAPAKLIQFRQSFPRRRPPMISSSPWRTRSSCSRTSNVARDL